MPQISDWWSRQFVEGMKEIARAYDRFCITREIEDLDISDVLHDELNGAYNMSLDLLDIVKFGRALLGKQALPHN